ncbi:MAG TPA: hypothetical protein VGG07_09180 [Solirubrobacteraceae bacterium]|jgi:hypothetical protein
MSASIPISCPCDRPAYGIEVGSTPIVTDFAACELVPAAELVAAELVAAELVAAELDAAEVVDGDELELPHPATMAESASRAAQHNANATRRGRSELDMHLSFVVGSV